ncbi:hypothetical protein [Staphylococcus borealis]|uniref:hypothetical protein n=1 Tax=Staphylococcus borealis TaxID=2742203 RepID=UPI002DB98F73|nr:hypothetical protein [Staphylococcus borealis]MEB7365419.1 hypothetical protein [Staphylococcus borealis]
MPKIKQKVEMTPKEFLKHLLEQEETEVELDGYTFNYNEEHYSFDPEITANEVISYDPHSGTFIVEVEEEITEETRLKEFFMINSKTKNLSRYTGKNIASVVKKHHAKALYIKDDDFNMTLIWKDGAMVDD